MADRYPESSETILYIRSGYSLTLQELIEQAQIHFKDDYIDLNTLQITSEKIHTRCIGYDLYDGSDWDDYIIIERV